MTTADPSAHPGSGKERLQGALVRIHRSAPGQPTRRRRAPGPEAVTAPGAVQRDPAVSGAAAAGAVSDDTGGSPSLPAELVELVDRLDNIADRLADLEHPGRPLPATRALFAEWVRLRKWEEIPFSEFLTLRRAGRL